MLQKLTKEKRFLQFTKKFYSQQPKVLITGALGQIGTELVSKMRQKYGVNNVIASDVKMPPIKIQNEGPFEFCDVNDETRLEGIVKREKITWILHLAAFLSAAAETHLSASLKLNSTGLHSVLDVAEKYNLRVYVPSSIAALPPTEDTPNIAIQRPRGIYGIGKVYAELLGEYYCYKRNVDFRSIRYPGIISYLTEPGGGTTDYAVDIFYSALKGETYKCYLKPDSRLPMMYMEDCIDATIRLLEAPTDSLNYRTYNISAYSFTPVELTKAIQKHLPDFKISYEIDPVRQFFADTWPKSMNDDDARKDWKHAPNYTLDAMVQDMLEKLSIKLNLKNKFNQ
eukprot:gene9516-1723_t